MSERRAVFVDVDGTLVGHDGRIPPSATDAVRAARANGHLVLLCTGRTPASLWPAVDAVGFDGAVAASGAWVTLGGTTNAPETVLVQRSVSPDVLAEVRAFFDEHDTDVLLDGVDAIHGSPRVRERLLRVVGTGADPDGPFGFVERIRTDGKLPEPIVKVEFIG
ncbi:MAG: HAD hydrolase family protein, partial [Propionibacteriaceae bacterium]|nr:HAD hydrolase family protein [Propionibacteriaceae bacterium]